MIDLSMLHPGDTIHIVDEWPTDEGRQNHRGLMDHWLGHNVTVLGIHGDEITIREDAGEWPYNEGGHWTWYPEMIEEIVYPSEPAEPASEEELAAFFE